MKRVPVCTYLDNLFPHFIFLACDSIDNHSQVDTALRHQFYGIHKHGLLKEPFSRGIYDPVYKACISFLLIKHVIVHKGTKLQLRVTR